MIGYFIKAGDENVSKTFTPYVWGENGFGTLLEEALNENTNNYDLDFLLIQYYVEGKFPVYGPDFPKVGRYSKKEKSIEVRITVKEKDFFSRDEKERREYIVESTLLGIRLVQDKFKKSNLKFDFEKLYNKVESISKKYLK